VEKYDRSAATISKLRWRLCKSNQHKSKPDLLLTTALQDSATTSSSFEDQPLDTINYFALLTSVIRFGKILSLGRNFKSLWPIVEGLFSIWQNICFVPFLLRFFEFKMIEVSRKQDYIYSTLPTSSEAIWR